MVQDSVKGFLKIKDDSMNQIYTPICTPKTCFFCKVQVHGGVQQLVQERWSNIIPAKQLHIFSVALAYALRALKDSCDFSTACQLVGCNISRQLLGGAR